MINLKLTPTARALMAADIIGNPLAGVPTPSLDLDFVNSSTLDSRITFSRASGATYFDSSGVLQTAASGVARFDHNPTTLAPLGLLIEEQRTNSIRNNTMQGAATGTPGTLPTNWTVSSAGGLTTNVVGTGTTAGITWIDVQIVGTSSATLYQLSFDGNTTIAASATQAWTGSFWVAQVAGTTTNITATNVRVAARDSGGSTLSVSDSAAITLSSTLTRYFSTFASLPASSAFVQESLRLAITNGAAIDITLRIGLPQLEQGAFATSVIPTTTAAATRNADAASMTGTNFSSWYRADEGTVYGELNSASALINASIGFAVSDGTFNNTLYLSVAASGASNQPQIAYRAGSALQALLTLSGAYVKDEYIKIGSTYKVNDFAAVKNAGTAVTDTSGILITNADRLVLGVNWAGTGNVLNGTIKKLAFYPTRLSNAQLQALTR